MERRLGGRRWQRIVATVVARDGGRCHLCGMTGATSADHVVALADGGSNSLSNLRCVHRVCNYAKNAKRTNRLRRDWQHQAARRRNRRVWNGAISLDDRVF
jgi:5-methylcytosine-specific restriction endonuclease McrA